MFFRIFKFFSKITSDAYHYLMNKHALVVLNYIG